MYKDHYGFFYKIKQTVYKWWCVVYKPVYKLTHNGRWPQEKEPFYNPETEKEDEQQKLLAEQMVNHLNNSAQNNVDNIITHTESLETLEIKSNDSEPDNSSDINSNTSQDIDSDALARANEIMERLMREAAEDEAKKQAQIDEAKRTADEQARLAAIMKANQVDISQYIEQGKANQNKIQEETL